MDDLFSNSLGPSLASIVKGVEPSKHTKPQKHIEDSQHDKSLQNASMSHQKETGILQADKKYQYKDRSRYGSSLVNKELSGSQDKPRLAQSLENEIKDDENKTSRTVFFGNICTTALTSSRDRKILMKHLEAGGYIEGGPKRTLQTLRFRSTAFSDHKVPRRVAFSKKLLMGSICQSTNAYGVYVSRLCAQSAARKLNASFVIGRHLRADYAAKPLQHDNMRCVFVGNLGFVDQEIEPVSDDRNIKQKNRPRADYEEGLWNVFSKCGKVENVRIIRDKATRIGKGFGYVQFSSANAVEKALLLDNRQFPPQIPRRIRVQRAG